MKSFGLLLVAIVGLVTAQEFDCPAPGGAFPHPEFCDYYYLCVDNVGTLEQCEVPQLFDLVYDGCNFPELVDCGDRIPPATPTPPPGEFQCPAPGGAFPHEEQCALYWECVENVPELKECPADQGFDLVYDGCNWLWLMDCGDRDPPTTGTPTAGPPTPTAGPPTPTSGPGTTQRPPGTTPPTAPPQGTTPRPPGTTTDSQPVTATTGAPGEFECPAADGLFPNPLDCSTYYSCANFIGILSPCPETLLFRHDNTGCDFPQNVDCGDRPIPEQ